MKTADYLIADGTKKGLEQGVQQGQYDTQLNIAHKLKEKGMDSTAIKDITDLDLGPWALLILNDLLRNYNWKNNVRIFS